jgi:hypothetical protein
MFSNRDGSYLWAAQLKDDRHLAEFEKKYEEAERSREPYRPPLEGYDALLAAINGLRNDVRADKGLPMIAGPKSPVDRIKDRKKAISNRRLDELGL